MKTINKSFNDTVNEVIDAFSAIGRYVVSTLDQMSWPGVVALCIVLALFLTILPLAITLFVIVLVAKLLINLFRKEHGPQDHIHQEQ